MAAIADLSELINLQTGGNNGNPENIFYHKVGRVAGAAATAPAARLSTIAKRHRSRPAHRPAGQAHSGRSREDDQPRGGSLCCSTMLPVLAFK